MRIAAILEDADANFARAIQTVDGYREYYGTYLPHEQMEDELKKLQQVLTFDEQNRGLAIKAARIGVSLERWVDVVDILEGFVNDWENALVTVADSPNKRKTRGEALDAAMVKEEQAGTSAERRRARAVLEEFRDPRAANLLLDYGVALWRLGERKDEAQVCLKRASGLALDSADALIALADTYDEDKNPEKALEHYRLAFEINPLEPRALRGYLQLTVEISRNIDFVPPMRPTLLNVIQRCRDRAALGIYLPWAYFDIGFFSLLLRESYEGIGAFAKAVELCHSDTPIQASLDQARRLRDVLADKPEAAEWSLLERFLQIARLVKYDRLVEDAMATIGPQVANGQCPKLRDKVVIVAGGCAPGDEQRLHDFGPLLQLAFRDFSGTIFSGGTRSGVGLMVGELPDPSCGPILKVACLPEHMSLRHKTHDKYICYRHPGNSFSPLGAVQVWADILSQGIVPASVRVLGISGGKLAGFEYRLALLMGAKAGVLQGSGRAADAILEDPDWMDHPHLIALPNDPQTVKLFVAGFSHGVLTDAQREEAARLAHERNVEKRERESVKAIAPENQPWDTLRQDLKASILERVDLIAEQLHAVGLRAVKQDQLDPETIPVAEFTIPQIEKMAEIEHGRWCVAKFLDGWRWGERKDDQAKTHPDLIAWCDLDEPAREKDRHYVRQIPSLLKEQGFTIVALQNFRG